jgi:hypothetical protein
VRYRQGFWFLEGDLSEVNRPRVKRTVHPTGKEKKLSEFFGAVLAFLSMAGAVLLGLFSKTTLPSAHLQDDTAAWSG